MEQEEKYSCQNPGCGATGTADQMWTLDLRATGGKKVVVCAPCGRLARKEKIRTFKMSILSCVSRSRLPSAGSSNLLPRSF